MNTTGKGKIPVLKLFKTTAMTNGVQKFARMQAVQGLLTPWGEKQMSDTLALWKKRMGMLPKRSIGVALEEGGLLAAEIRRVKEDLSVSKSASMVYPEGVSIDDPERLGAALKQFLREQGIAARKAVIGIPAKWVMLREKTIPPSGLGSVAGILKIHAEREFSIAPEELALEYTGTVRTDGESRLFLWAMLKKRLDKILKAFEIAGLEAHSVTVTTSVLYAAAADGMEAPPLAVYVRPGYTEFLAGEGGRIADIKYFQKHGDAEGYGMAAEVRRAVSAHVKQASGANKEKILLWDAVEGDETGAAAFLEAALPAGVEAVVPGVRCLVPGVLGKEAFKAAGPYFIDFLNSRMAPIRKKITRRHLLWASGILLGGLILFLGFLISFRMNLSDVAQLKADLSKMRPDIQAAEDVVEKVGLAGRWYEGRPRVLDALYELTRMFPEEGRVWTTSLALNEEMSGIISGKALDEQDVIEVMDKMKATPRFSDVEMVYMRDNGKNSQEISFSMNFSVTEAE